MSQITEDYRSRQNWAASPGQERELTGHALKRNSIYEETGRNWGYK